MYIHTKARMIYLAHPRTGSQATREILFARGFVQHNDHHSRLPPRFQTGEYNVATAIRNHFDAIVSWWATTNREYVLGPEYIDQLMEIQAPAYFPHPNRLWALHVPFASTILRFETLFEDLRIWFEEGGLEPPDEFPVVNMTKQKHGAPYTAFVPRPLVPVVRERFAEEMEEYGYDYNIPRVTKQ